MPVMGCIIAQVSREKFFTSLKYRWHLFWNQPNLISVARNYVIQNSITQLNQSLFEGSSGKGHL